jgi:hypothetical protein
MTGAPPLEAGGQPEGSDGPGSAARDGEDRLILHGARVVQLVAAPAGYRVGEGENARPVLALALCELTLGLADGESWTGAEIFPVVGGGGEPLEIEAPFSPPWPVDLFHVLSAVGDLCDRPRVYGDGCRPGVA